MSTSTPRQRLRAIPADLLRRRESSKAEATNARKLLRYLDLVGIRPTFAEIEEERARRLPSGHHPHPRKDTELCD